VGRVVGLTGGIGTGKSTVAGILQRWGTAIIDADVIGHEILAEETVVKALVAAFGTNILQKPGTVDRAKLGTLVFGSSAKLQILNRLVHPRIFREVKGKIDVLKAEGQIVVLEAPLLIEAEWTRLVDEIWVTVAPERVVLQRLKARTGLSEEAIRARMRGQLDQREREKYADILISTDRTIEDLERYVGILYRERFIDHLEQVNGST
jgi:dephospho-CoA kinase